MKYTKDFPRERAIAYKEVLERDIVGRYLDPAEKRLVIVYVNPGTKLTGAEKGGKRRK